MSGSHRLLIAAIVGLAIFQPIHTSSYAQAPAPKAEGSPKQNPQALDLSPIADELKSLSRAVEAIKPENKSAEEIKREEDDLRAQQDTAKWAWYMYVITTIATTLTALGIILLAFTLHFTRRAANASDEMVRQAEQTTVAALKSLEIAQDSSARELRAYLGIEKIDFEINSVPVNAVGTKYEPTHVDEPGAIYNDFVAVTLKNFGQTPASNVTCFGLVAPVPFLARLEPGFDFDSTIRVRSPSLNTLTRALVSSGQSETIKSGIFDVRDIWAAQRKEKSLIIWGRAYYRDIYERPWSTRFCYMWEPWHPRGARFVPYDEFNGEDQKDDHSL